MFTVSVNIDNIELEFGNAFRRLCDSPLAIGDADRKTLLQRAADYGPARLLAMWIMYLEKEGGKGWQISLGKFLTPEKLNPYAMMLKRRQGGKVKQQYKFVERWYRCENFWKGCGANDRILSLDDGDVFPECLENSCGHCQGKMMKIEKVEIPHTEPVAVATTPRKAMTDSLQDIEPEPVDDFDGDMNF